METRKKSTDEKKRTKLEGKKSIPQIISTHKHTKVNIQFKRHSPLSIDLRIAWADALSICSLYLPFSASLIAHNLGISNQLKLLSITTLAALNGRKFNSLLPREPDSITINGECVNSEFKSI